MNSRQPRKTGGGGRKADRRAQRRAASIRRRNRRIIAAVVAIAAIVVLVIVLPGLFDDDPVEPSASVTIEGTEFAYSPDPVLALAGEVELTFDNKGKTGHELILLNEGVRITSPSQFDESMTLEHIPSIARDISRTRTIELDPGTYQIVCLLPGHFESGMEGDIIVSAPSAT